MKVECPICHVEGFLETRGNSQRVLHYVGYLNGRRVYKGHRIENKLRINENQSVRINKQEMGFSSVNNHEIRYERLSASQAYVRSNRPSYQTELPARIEELPSIANKLCLTDSYSPLPLYDSHNHKQSNSVYINKNRYCYLSLFDKMASIIAPFGSQFGADVDGVGLSNGGRVLSSEVRDSLSGSVIDWAAFEDWLKNRALSRRYAREILRYCRLWGQRFFDGDSSELLTMSSAQRRMCLSSLANLGKFTGCYKQFRAILEKYDLKYGESVKSEDAFMRLYNGEESTLSVEKWLDSLKGRLEWRWWFPLVFMAVTGLRPSEAINSLNRVAEYGLDGYLNRDTGILEQFRYKEFLRRSKKAFISVVGKRTIECLENWKEKTAYDGLRTHLYRRKLGTRFYDLRRLYGTSLSINGVQQEYIDTLQGRIGRSVFQKSYFRPDLEPVFEKVRCIIEPYEARWLD